jgi:hypothetical protein
LLSWLLLLLLLLLSRGQTFLVDPLPLLGGRRFAGLRFRRGRCFGLLGLFSFFLDWRFDARSLGRGRAAVGTGGDRFDGRSLKTKEHFKEQVCYKI